jgi:hypothetical protein
MLEDYFFDAYVGIVMIASHHILLFRAGRLLAGG